MAGESASASRPYPLLARSRAGSNRIRSRCGHALLGHAARDRIGESKGAVVALALAAQAGSIIPVDAQGDPVHPMITWFDRRQ